jgi:hypothetical protein
MLHPTQVTGYYTQLGSCHGAAGGAPAAGVGGGRNCIAKLAKLNNGAGLACPLRLWT